MWHFESVFAKALEARKPMKVDVERYIYFKKEKKPNDQQPIEKTLDESDSNNSSSLSTTNKSDKPKKVRWRKDKFVKLPKINYETLCKATDDFSIGIPDWGLSLPASNDVCFIINQSAPKILDDFKMAPGWSKELSEQNPVNSYFIEYMMKMTSREPTTTTNETSRETEKPRTSQSWWSSWSWLGWWTKTKSSWDLPPASPTKLGQDTKETNFVDLARKDDGAGPSAAPEEKKNDNVQLEKGTIESCPNQSQVSSTAEKKDLCENLTDILSQTSFDFTTQVPETSDFKTQVPEVSVEINQIDPQPPQKSVQLVTNVTQVPIGSEIINCELEHLNH